MQVKTNIKAGDSSCSNMSCGSNHNETQVWAAARGLKVQTGVKAGGINPQHNEAQVRAAARGLKVQTGVKAGVPVRGSVHVNVPR